jgi:hypothetical protein
MENEEIYLDEFSVMTTDAFLNMLELGSKTQLRKEIAGNGWSINRRKIRSDQYVLMRIVEGKLKGLWLMTREEIAERFKQYV